MKRYFITGTDTDCGKTHVMTQLLHAFPSSAALKPVASGCIEIDNQRVNPDAQQIQKITNLNLDLINPWRFKSPLSPHIASAREGVRLSSAEIAHHCLNVSLEGVNQLFIEGAGGLMVPLNEEETWIDFLQLSSIPVILVVGMKLGCINHALLTEAVLHTKQIQCVGWIANCIDPCMQALSENIATLSQKLSSPLLAQVPFNGLICCTKLEFFQL